MPGGLRLWTIPDAFRSDGSHRLLYRDGDIEMWEYYLMMVLNEYCVSITHAHWEFAVTLASIHRDFSCSHCVAIAKIMEQTGVKQIGDFVWMSKILPVWKVEEVTNKVENESDKLLNINGFVYYIEKIIPMHPGGAGHLMASVGKDATDNFEGKSGIDKHSNAARNFLQRYRLARC